VERHTTLPLEACAADRMEHQASSGALVAWAHPHPDRRAGIPPAPSKRADEPRPAWPGPSLLRPAVPPPAVLEEKPDPDLSGHLVHVGAAAPVTAVLAYTFVAPGRHGRASDIQVYGYIPAHLA